MVEMQDEKARCGNTGPTTTINKRTTTMGYDVLQQQEHQLEDLVIKLVETKEAEASVSLQRKELEVRIAAMVSSKDEGTDKRDVGLYQVTVTSKLTRSLDYDAYLAIEAGLPEGVRCVDLKPALNLKKLRALEMVDPGLPAQFVTTKPAKAAVKVEVIQ